MEDKDMVAEAPIEVIVGEAPARVNYEFADMYIKCSKCGAENKVNENVQGPIYYVLQTTNEDNLTLMCRECENRIGLYFKDAENPPVVEPTETAIVEDETESALSDSDVEQTENTTDEHVPQTGKVEEQV